MGWQGYGSTIRQFLSFPNQLFGRVSVSIEPAAGSPNCRWLTSPAPVVAMSWDQDVSASKLQASSPAERRRFIRAAAVLRARLLTPQGTGEATVLDASPDRTSTRPNS